MAPPKSAAKDDDVTPQPASAVRAAALVGVAELGAMTAGWPEDEPDRTIWRVLACARAGGDDVANDRLALLLPSFSPAEIADARARVEPKIPPIAPRGAALAELLAEPSITFAEAVTCGLLEDRDDAGPSCASST